MTPGDDFNWRTDDTIVYRYQPATAVYENTSGLIVVRQERGELDDDDTVLLVTPESGELLAAAIAKLSRELLSAGRSATATAAVRPNAADGDGDAELRQITFQPRPNGRGNPPAQINAFNGRATA